MMNSTLPQIIVVQSPPTLWENAANFATVLAMVGTMLAVGVALWTYRDSTAPNVVAYLQTEADIGALVLIIENMGSSVAYNITVAFKGELPVGNEFVPGVNKSFVYTGIPMLVPSANRNTVINIMSNAKDAKYDEECIATVQYFRSRSRFARKQTGEFVLEYSSFKDSIYAKGKQDQAANAMIHAAQALDRMARNSSMPKF